MPKVNSIHLYIFLYSTLALLLTINVASATTAQLSFDKELSQFNYPFPVHDFIISTHQQTLNMRYMDVGPRTEKKVIVLLHGKNFSGFYWEKIAQDLSLIHISEPTRPY